jgi:hypothetical protein
MLCPLAHTSTLHHTTTPHSLPPLQLTGTHHSNPTHPITVSRLASLLRVGKTCFRAHCPPTRSGFWSRDDAHPAVPLTAVLAGAVMLAGPIMELPLSCFPCLGPARCRPGPGAAPGFSPLPTHTASQGPATTRIPTLQQVGPCSESFRLRALSAPWPSLLL